MKNHGDRLRELKEKESLTDAEMQELIKLKRGGTFKRLPNLKTIGVVEIRKAVENFQAGAGRVMRAMRSGCYIEVISLRLQHADFWLRMYWVARNPGRKIFSPDDKRTFGQVIGDCARLGFREGLVERLKEFNQHRTEAIHKYLLGATDYAELREVCEESSGLDSEVGKYVAEEVGIAIP